ncbi:hypothetical protein R1sor_018542 [Riccia sorocarpa]|uniref:Uncharacterized protein n=1 Tax=Riccia sorocarpa TaxID=122646 RepID=A0ABD3IDP2_9MARC
MTDATLHIVSGCLFRYNHLCLQQCSNVKTVLALTHNEVARSEGREGALLHSQSQHTMQGGLNAVHRDVDNALEQSGQRSSEIGSHRGIGSHRVIPTRIVDGRAKERLWTCFPTLSQWFKPLPRITSENNREPNDSVSNQELLRYRAMLTGESRSFDTFLLDVPDCLDDVKAELSGYQRSQGSYLRNAQKTQTAELMSAMSAGPRASPLQRNECSTSSTSSDSVKKPDSPPGEAALRSLTPGVRSSKSPSAASSIRNGPSTTENLIGARPNSTRSSNSELVETQGVKDSPEFHAKQQIPPTVRNLTTKSASSKPPTKVVHCRTRSERILSRAQHRFQSSVKRDRIPSNRVSVLNRTRSTQQDAEPEIQQEQEEVNNRISYVRTGSKSRASSGANKNRIAQLLTDYIKRTRETCVNAAERENRVERPSPSFGSHNHRLSVHLDSSDTVTVRQSPAAYVRLIDLSPPTSCQRIPTCQENVEVEKADRSSIPVESSTSTNTPKPVTSHIKLVDSASSNSLLNEIPNTLSEEVDTGPTPPILDTRIELPKPSKNIHCYSKPQVRSSRPSDVVNIKSTYTNSSSSNPQEGASPPPLVVPQSLFRLKTDTYKLSRDTGTASSCSASSAAGDGTNNVDIMALDVLHELKTQPAPQSSPRRRVYEVAIPTGVWRLDFIPNDSSESLLTDCVPRNHQSLLGFSTASTSFSKKSVDGSNRIETQWR